MMDCDELTYRIAFASLRGINPTLATEILSRIGSEREFFAASSRRLSAVMGFNSRIFGDAYRAPLVEAAKPEVDFIEANDIRPLYYTDPDYPQRLLDADDSPVMLYLLGPVDLNRGHFVSIVGTRHATAYGLDFVNRLIADLAEMTADPITVISGLAFGIDAAAHSGALRHGLPTVGVLGHGLSMIYPAQHRSLAREMIRGGGGLVTEYMSGSPVHKGNFIARNRLVASMCDALVVAESARKGGALITARLASGYNRDLFALPGRTSDPYSQGCNRLIASHSASLIQCADDLIDAMGWARKPAHGEQPSLFVDISPEEQAVLDFIAHAGEAHITQITMKLDLPVSRVMALLVDMEFKNLILTYPGGKYRLA